MLKHGPRRKRSSHPEAPSLSPLPGDRRPGKLDVVDVKPTISGLREMTLLIRSAVPVSALPRQL